MFSVSKTSLGREVSRDMSAFLSVCLSVCRVGRDLLQLPVFSMVISGDSAANSSVQAPFTTG